MRKKSDIGGILSRIQHTERFGRRELGMEDGPIRPTRFGVPLTQVEEGHFRIDLSGVRVFSGLAGLSAQLIAQFEEQTQVGGTDVLARLVVQPDMTPELAEVHIKAVVLTARSRVAKKILAAHEILTAQMRMVLGALQSRTVLDSLLGRRLSEKEGEPVEPKAWMFPFGAEGGLSEAFVLMEYEPEGAFLRMTVEMERDGRLHLKRIPHRIFEERERHLYAQDVPAMAEKIASSIHHAGQNQREYFIEEPNRQPGLFAVLYAAGLPGVQQLRFAWSNRDLTAFLMGPDPRLRDILAKALLMLEDETIVHALADVQVVEMASGANRVFLDVSRRGSCLNVAFEAPRRKPDMAGYLRRLPRLANETKTCGVFLNNTRIVFVHHLTSETLAFIRALQDTGCAFLHGLFIRYKGVTPDAYMEALMSMPEERFIFHSLHNLEKEGRLTGWYVLSRQFSPVDRKDG